MFTTEHEDDDISVEHTWLRCNWVVDVDAIRELLVDDVEETAGTVLMNVSCVDILDESVCVVSMLFCCIDDCKPVSLSDNVVAKFESSSLSWLVCFCISQLHRVHKGGGSEITVVGVGGMISIVAGG